MSALGEVAIRLAPSIVSGHLHLGQHVAAGRVVLYDGVCNLCNWGVRWVAARDPDKRVMFCSVQSQAAEPYLRAMGLTRQQVLQRSVFVEYNTWSAGSTAVLRVCRYLRRPWPLVQYLLLVPLPVRDAMYDTIAASRYRLFGRTPSCQVPDVELLDRFVDRDELMAGLCSSEGLLADEDADSPEPADPGARDRDQHQGGTRRQEEEGPGRLGHADGGIDQRVHGEDGRGKVKGEDGAGGARSAGREVRCRALGPGEGLRPGGLEAWGQKSRLRLDNGSSLPARPTLAPQA